MVCLQYVYSMNSSLYSVQCTGRKDMEEVIFYEKTTTSIVLWPTKIQSFTVSMLRVHIKLPAYFCHNQRIYISDRRVIPPLRCP